MIDTHCHIYSTEFESDQDSVIINAKEAGISHIFMPNVDSFTIESMLSVEKKYANCHAMMGLHPCHVKENYLDELKIVDAWFDQRDFCGVGETGIDLYWDKTFFEEQILAFEYQIDIALSKNVPIIIHSRDSLDITIDIISKNQNGKLQAIFHCFNGTVEQAAKIADIGAYIGIGGVVTYKNAKMDEVVQSNGLRNVVLETDSPYLPPVPHRGKRNEPLYLTHIVDKIAEYLCIDRKEVIEKTNENALKLFPVLKSNESGKL